MKNIVATNIEEIGVVVQAKIVWVQLSVGSFASRVRETALDTCPYYRVRASSNTVDYLAGIAD